MTERPPTKAKKPASSSNREKPARTGRATTKTRRAKKEPGGPRRTRSGFVALVGRPNVGKSTLLNALLGEPIAITSHHPQTTRDRIAGILTRGQTQFVFFDTPGIHSSKTKLGAHMNAAASEAAELADVVVFLTEPPPGELDVREDDFALLERLRADGKARRAPVLFAINKIDRIKEKSRLLKVLEAYSKGFPFEAMVPLSARRSDGIDRLLREIERLLPEGPFHFPEDELTDRPARYFVAEYVREQVLRKTREEVPHGVAVTVESFDESGKVLRISVTVHVDKDAHKKILIGKGGDMLKRIGTNARARVEALLAQKVHLALFVRTTPRWYESDSALREMGYVTENR